MKTYYYVDADRQAAGPVSPEDFAALGITATTYVWRKGLPAWTRAGELEELDFRPEEPPEPPAVDESRPEDETEPPGNNAEPQVGPAEQSEATDHIPELPPDNCLVWAVLATVVCCLPLGLVALLKASHVNDYWLMGQRDLARRTATEARNYCILAFGVGVALQLLYVLFAVAASFF